MKPPHTLLLPDWPHPGSDLPMAPFQKVQFTGVPVRSVWTADLERQVEGSPLPVVLVAVGLGCLALQHWVKPTEDRVLCALFINPLDAERCRGMREMRSFAPVPRMSLAFPSVVVAGNQNRLCKPERAEAFARSWGSQWVEVPGEGPDPQRLQHLLDGLIKLSLKVLQATHDGLEQRDVKESLLLH